MEWKDLAIEINKVLLDSYRKNIEINTLLVGNKEKELIDKLESDGIPLSEKEARNAWNLKILRVEEDSFLSVAYVVDKNEPAIKVSDFTAIKESVGGELPPPPPPPKRLIREDVKIGRTAS